MEPNILWIFCYDTLQVLCIKLSDEEMKLSEQYNTFEEFISENIEDKYGFALSCSEWMLSDWSDVERHGFEHYKTNNVQVPGLVYKRFHEDELYYIGHLEGFADNSYERDGYYFVSTKFLRENGIDP